MKRLEQLKKEFLGMTSEWYDIDNKILDALDLEEEYGVFSANPYDAMDFGHTYIVDNDKSEGFNVEFEVVKESDDRISNTTVRVTNIEWL